MPCHLILVVLFCFINVASSAQQSVNSKKISIPFTITSYNNFVIKAILNGKDTARLMLHTASDDITLTEEASKKLKSVKFDTKLDSVQSWGGNENSGAMSKNNSFTIGKLRFDSISIWQNKNSGQETDGKIGLNFFEHKVVEFNIDSKQLIIAEDLPKDIGSYEKIAISKNDIGLFIKTALVINDSSYVNDFLIHTGYAGSVLLDDKFSKETAIDKYVKILGEKKLQDSYGNVLVTKKGLVPSIKIGKQVLSNVPVGFFEGAIANQKISLMGCDVWKRFNFILDAKREFIYLKASKYKASASLNS